MAASLLSSRRIININGSEAIDNTVSHVVLEASGKVEQLSCFEELNPTNCVRNPKNSCRRLHRCAFRWDGKKAACSQKNTTRTRVRRIVYFSSRIHLFQNRRRDKIGRNSAKPGGVKCLSTFPIIEHSKPKPIK